MTLDEKIGQMTQPDKLFIQNPDDVAKYSFGSVLSGGDSDPKTGNDLISWTDMYDEYQSHALRSRLHVPLIYGVDAVHGHNNVIGATVFPQNIALGCTRSSDLVEKAARITACGSAGYDVGIGRFAPVSLCACRIFVGRRTVRSTWSGS